MKKPMAILIATAAALSLAGCSSATTSDTADSSSSSPSTAPSSSGSSSSESADSVTPVTITIGDQDIEATLNDAPAAQDLIGRLPVTFSAVRNGEIEYFGALDEPLTEVEGNDYPEVGPRDIVYYAPNDEVAIIIDETSSPGQLTKIGDITSDLGDFDGLPEDADIRIELR